jgi:hypothetical protein
VGGGRRIFHIPHPVLRHTVEGVLGAQLSSKGGRRSRRLAQPGLEGPPVGRDENGVMGDAGIMVDA